MAYTDGLVERRSETIDVGLDRLRASLSACSTCDDVEAVADELITACLGDRPTDDDIALLVVRVATDAPVIGVDDDHVPHEPVAPERVAELAERYNLGGSVTRLLAALSGQSGRPTS